jgi:hypothetical protein
MLTKLENLGYYPLPRTHAGSPGHSGLLVLLHAGGHPDAAFVPHSLHAWVIGQDKSVHWMSFEADTMFSSVRTVTPGKIVLRDQDSREVEFFVFGGALTAGAVAGGAVYSFHSHAPVLTISRTYHNIATHLAVEVEVLLAEQRAALLAEEQAFLQGLAEIDPFRLYLSCLDAILTRYGQVTALHRRYHDFFQALQAEKAWLVETGQWTEKVAGLAELLGWQNRGAHHV